MDTKKQYLPPIMFGEDQADGAFEEDKDKEKELDEIDEADDPSKKREDDINEEEEEEE